MKTTIQIKIQEVFDYLNDNEDKINDINREKLIELFEELENYPNIFDCQLIKSTIGDMNLKRVIDSRLNLAIKFIIEEIKRINI
jgi:hypothetical protein